jgi:predicted aspartyl protease
MGKGKAHYIEVLSDSEEEEEAEKVQDNEQDKSTDEKPHEEVKSGAITTLLSVPRFHTFRIHGVVQGQRVTVLIDGGATHNFIDSALVAKRGIPTVDFEGFDVVVAGGRVMPCTQKIPQLCVALGNYTVTDDFYVVELQDTNIILGVQWLVSIGKHSVDYQAMELEFKEADGRKVVLRGMSNDAPGSSQPNGWRVYSDTGMSLMQQSV